jgi:hypothetical protein
VGIRLFFKKKKKLEIPFKAYSGNEPYIFVSYAHANSDIVFPIMKELHNRDVKMWYDEGINAGTEWSQEIADKILNCAKMVLFISPESMNSNHCRQEINFANSKYKQILPVYIKPTTLSAGLEMTLSVFQAIFLYSFKNNEDDFYKQVCNALSTSFVNEDANATQLIGSALLRLDEYGDKTLPPVIHLTDSGKFSIGRFDVNLGVQQSDFEFSKEKNNISRRHAFFEKTHDGFTVTDLGSMAGTWVDGQRIAPNTPILLQSGNRVAFGNAGASYVFEE